MTTNPITLFFDAFFAIIGAFLAPVADIVSGPYATWLRTMLGNVMQFIVG